MSDYAFEGPKWSSSLVTWSFASGGGSFSGSIGDNYRDTIRAAVTSWTGVASLTIEEVPDSEAVDIRVGWGLFDGSQVGETGYSYQTADDATFVAGTILRLEDPSAKPVGTALTSCYAGTSTTLYQVMLHEFGHALGLDHSTDDASVMFPTLGAGNDDVGAPDIAGIQSLYGAGAAAVSAPASASIAAPVPILPATISLPDGQTPVYRFFDTKTGAQFLTGSTDERNSLILTRPDLAYEGLGLAGIDVDSDDPNAAEVYRFFDTHTGTHLFTTSADEAKTIGLTRPDLVAEASSFKEHVTAQDEDVPIYRFFEKADGTHFFTGSSAEQATLIATRPDMVYEGVAFYAPKLS